MYSQLLYTQVRTKVLDVHRLLYEPRGGLRSRKDLIDEEQEIKENRHKNHNPTTYSIFGNMVKTPKDLIFYSDRKGGKGYSDFANTSYPNRPYVWGPLRFMFKVSNVFIVVFLIIFCVDIDW